MLALAIGVDVLLEGLELLLLEVRLLTRVEQDKGGKGLEYEHETTSFHCKIYQYIIAREVYQLVTS